MLTAAELLLQAGPRAAPRSLDAAFARLATQRRRLRALGAVARFARPALAAAHACAPPADLRPVVSIYCHKYSFDFAFRKMKNNQPARVTHLRRLDQNYALTAGSDAVLNIFHVPSMTLALSITDVISLPVTCLQVLRCDQLALTNRAKFELTELTPADRWLLVGEENAALHVVRLYHGGAHKAVMSFRPLGTGRHSVDDYPYSVAPAFVDARVIKTRLIAVMSNSEIWQVDLEDPELRWEALRTATTKYCVTSVRWSASSLCLSITGIVKPYKQGRPVSTRVIFQYLELYTALTTVKETTVQYIPLACSSGECGATECPYHAPQTPVHARYEFGDSETPRPVLALSQWALWGDTELYVLLTGHVWERGTLRALPLRALAETIKAQAYKINYFERIAEGVYCLVEEAEIKKHLVISKVSLLTRHPTAAAFAVHSEVEQRGAVHCLDRLERLLLFGTDETVWLWDSERKARLWTHRCASRVAFTAGCVLSESETLVGTALGKVMLLGDPARYTIAQFRHTPPIQFLRDDRLTDQSGLPATLAPASLPPAPYLAYPSHVCEQRLLAWLRLTSPDAGGRLIKQRLDLFCQALAGVPQYNQLCASSLLTPQCSCCLTVCTANADGLAPIFQSPQTGGPQIAYPQPEVIYRVDEDVFDDDEEEEEDDDDAEDAPADSSSSSDGELLDEEPEPPAIVETHREPVLRAGDDDEEDDDASSSAEFMDNVLEESISDSADEEPADKSFSRSSTLGRVMWAPLLPSDQLFASVLASRDHAKWSVPFKQCAGTLDLGGQSASLRAATWFAWFRLFNEAHRQGDDRDEPMMPARRGRRKQRVVSDSETDSSVVRSEAPCFICGCDQSPDQAPTVRGLWTGTDQLSVLASRHPQYEELVTAISAQHHPLAMRGPFEWNQEERYAHVICLFTICPRRPAPFVSISSTRVTVASMTNKKRSCNWCSRPGVLLECIECGGCAHASCAFVELVEVPPMDLCSSVIAKSPLELLWDTGIYLCAPCSQKDSAGYLFCHGGNLVGLDAPTVPYLPADEGGRVTLCDLAAGDLVAICVPNNKFVLTEGLVLDSHNAAVLGVEHYFPLLPVCIDKGSLDLMDETPVQAIELCYPLIDAVLLLMVLPPHPLHGFVYQQRWSTFPVPPLRNLRRLRPSLPANPLSEFAFSRPFSAVAEAGKVKKGVRGPAVGGDVAEMPPLLAQMLRWADPRQVLLEALGAATAPTAPAETAVCGCVEAAPPLARLAAAVKTVKALRKEAFECFVETPALPRVGGCRRVDEALSWEDDYHRFIARPSALEAVLARTEAGQYDRAAAFWSDVAAIYRNSREYNGAEDALTASAGALCAAVHAAARAAAPTACDAALFAGDF